MHKRASHDAYVTKEAEHGELTDLFKKTDDDGMDKKEESGCDKRASHMGSVSQGIDDSAPELRDSSEYMKQAEGKRPVY